MEVIMKMLFRWLFSTAISKCIVITANLKKRFNEFDTKSWPESEAYLHSASAKLLHENYSYRVRIEYSYFVREYRSGHRSCLFPSKEDAEGFIESISNCISKVRYSTNNPDRSYLTDNAIQISRKLPQQGPTFRQLS